MDKNERTEVQDAYRVLKEYLDLIEREQRELLESTGRV
jgi:hypothetical protein